MAENPGHILSYYNLVANYIIVIPLAILLVVSIVYNILVGFSTKWMYANAWIKEGYTRENPPPMDSSYWDELFIVNIKISNYLLGSTVALSESKDGYYKLLIHDYEVYMPLAIVLIQVSELAVMIVSLALFFDTLVLQVSSECVTGVDCFYFNETNSKALPIDCDSPDFNKTLKLTCFRIVFDPIAAAVSAGGFLKVVPQVAFALLTFQYIKYLNLAKKRLKLKIKHGSIIVHAMAAGAVCAGFVALGLAALLFVIYRLQDAPSANPIVEIVVYLIFLMYFAMAAFLWYIIPFQYTASVGQEKD
ncbi:PREDICTED: uncharacterized protein LOC109581269 [Amphimedon queenslandica]|uniref:Uncharacterized protein n=1 Tax=Amphimedon queenslandica TaxID=400682 RepID=A0A1X7V3R1_AMPQE|nr:PREDICTED: uncharacterized protein LOC109581269 [Amphimedon queenslandica]|eukprot:XP_019850807.1 PREDICTED: uncharacterized protein LOC109581269 [Amphimedon queenslandica]